jgi:hypothetical protein
LYSDLITKARNLHVTIYMRSNGLKVAGKIIDFDEVFCEVMVKIHADGRFAATREEFDSLKPEWREDRILISIADISIIAEG